MSEDADFALPLRVVDRGRPAQSSGPHNVNAGAGSQKNYDQTEGFNNSQYNADTINVNVQAAKRTEYNGTYSYTSLQAVASYVARPELQKQAEERLRHARAIETLRASILVLVGLGGGGKTQLALNYVQTHRNDYKAVFWIDARLRTAVDRDFVQIYRLLLDSQEDMASLQADIDRVITAVKAWFHGRDGRWLFVFDNADSLDDQTDAYFVNLRHYLPDAPHVEVIVTTRTQTATDMTELEAVEVGELAPAEAVDMFTRCGRFRSPTADVLEEIDRIVHELGYLALAITVAGAYVAATPRMRSNIKAYLPEYRLRRKKLLDRKPKEQVHRYTESVLSTWETSYAAIAKQCPPAARLLSSFAFLDSQDIFLELFRPHPESIVRHSTNQERDWRGVLSPDIPLEEVLDEALEALSTYCLVQWKQEQCAYSMHKLVHAWGYERLPREERKTYSAATLELVVEAVDRCNPAPEERLRLVPHIMANFAMLYDSVDGADPDIQDMLDRLQGIGVFFSELGQWSDTRVVEEFVLRERSRLLGTEHLDTILAMSNLANTLGDLGQLDEAVLMQHEVLDERKRILGNEHSDTISAMSNLASTLGDLGQLNRAVEMKREVLEKRTRILGGEHSDTISAMSNLAGTLGDLGQLNGAVEMMREVLGKMKRILGLEHPSTISAMSNLATTLGNLGQLNEAVEMQREVLERRKRILGDDHPDTISAMNNLANTLGDLGQLNRAVEMKREVLEKRKRILHDDHPDTISAMNNLANTLGDLGQLNEAVEMKREVLEKRKRILGDDHPDTISAMNNLANTLGDLGQLNRAVEMKREVLEKRKRILGSEHPSTISAMNNLASTLGDLGRLQEAITLLEVAAQSMKSTGFEDHPYAKVIESNLASLTD